MAKYLLDDNDVQVLRNLVHGNKPHEKLAYDDKKQPFTAIYHFKTLEAMGVSVAHSAKSVIFPFNQTSDFKVHDDDAYLVDDTFEYTSLLSGARGVCLASSVFNILAVKDSGGSTGSTSVVSIAKTYLGLSTTDYASTDALFTMDNLEPMDGIGTTLTTLTGRNSFNLSVANNGLCLMKYNGYTSEYELLKTYYVTPVYAKSYLGLSYTAYNSTDTTVVINTLEPMDGIGTTLTSLTARNTFQWNVVSGGKCYIKYNEYSSVYDLLQTYCT